MINTSDTVYTNAAILFDSNETLDIDNNEYARGVVELIALMTGFGSDSYEDIAKALSAYTSTTLSRQQMRLESLRVAVNAETISYSEITELQGLAEHIDAGDVQLLEWAGESEFDRCPETDDFQHQVTDGSCDQCGAKNFN